MGQVNDVRISNSLSFIFSNWDSTWVSFEEFTITGMVKRLFECGVCKAPTAKIQVCRSFLKTNLVFVEKNQRENGQQST